MDGRMADRADIPLNYGDKALLIRIGGNYRCRTLNQFDGESDVAFKDAPKILKVKTDKAKAKRKIDKILAIK